MAEVKQIDRRWIFLAVALALTLTVAFPFPQPITPSPSVRNVYEFVEELPAGSAVLVAADYDPQARAELVPMTRALLSHCLQRDLKVVGMTFWREGIGLHEELFNQAGERYGKRYGTDYAYLGYKPGTMAQVITNMGERIQSAFPQDARGQPTANMPIFSEIRSLRDFSYMIDLAAGNTPEGWIIYGGDKYGVPLGVGCTAVIGPDLYVYTNTGQLNGIVAGLRGAADYEQLIEEPGQATRGMSAQSTIHAIIVAFIIIGNIVYFRGRRAEQPERGGEA